MTDPQFRAWAAQQLTAARAEIATLLAGPNEDTAAYETWQSGVKRGLVAALGDGHELVGEFASLTMVTLGAASNGRQSAPAWSIRPGPIAMS